MVDALLNSEGNVNIYMVGKYVELPDAYKSINEALLHAGITNRTNVTIHYIDAEALETDDSLMAELKKADGILVPGGFGERGTMGKMKAITYARENNVPYLGICLGMQLAVIEFARNVLKLDANLITEWMDERGELQRRNIDSDLGGTMRLGGQKAELVEDSKLRDIYDAPVIVERHRHRYEMNNSYIEQLESEHPWFIGVQYHPEFTSSPREGHPLFHHFVKASIEAKK
ncbi:MAG: hypothetical protein CR966_01325 [Pseudomonadales bacterium]|nr:MAG: hypothetical protein CR966_01325 [Pseudomonadales bacterium]